MTIKTALVHIFKHVEDVDALAIATPGTKCSLDAADCVIDDRVASGDPCIKDVSKATRTC